jgi:acetoacetate decarboxylase
MFVRTDDQTRRLLAMLARPSFNGAQMLQVRCRANEAAVRRAIPPQFDLIDEARVIVEVGHWAGGIVGPFGGGGLYIPCRFGDHEGLYVLVMYMDSHNAIVFGRETFGEPKKYASASLLDDGTTVSGSLSRAGVTFCSLHMVKEQSTSHDAAVSRNFNTLVRFRPDGSGLDGDVPVYMATFELGTHTRSTGAASVTLVDTPFDRFSELGILDPVDASYVQGDVRASNEAVGTIESSVFLPHAFARYDDWLTLSDRG